MKPSMSRRRLVALMGSVPLLPLVPTPALAEDLPATPRMTEGPFYPRILPRDADWDLTHLEGRAARARGSPLEVSGRLLERSGRPLANARVEIWQCDATGHYHHVGEPEHAIDANFQGFGAAGTDAEGRYRFRTIRPVAYPGRTPHIHFNAIAGQRRLTSQMFIEGEPRNERDGLYRSLGREARLVTVKLAEAGGMLMGKLDIVLA